jgi:hypothetical protein
MARKKHYFYFSDTEIKESFAKYGKKYFPELAAAGLVASDEDVATARKLLKKGESLFGAILQILRYKAELLAERNQNID